VRSETRGGTTTVTGEEDAVRSVVMDYLAGWFEADQDRMQRALHPELVKRCRGIEGDDPDALETLSAREMIDATADGVGRSEDAPDRQIEIRIDYLGGGIASVQCFCHRYVDLLHLINMPDGWKIVNAAWRLRSGP
jgi:Putative lumazine-binding